MEFLVGGLDLSEWDFFVSYTSDDLDWATWIAWQLESAGYTVLIQDWDFVGGSNWINQMQRAVTGAAHTIAVLSTKYLSASKFGAAEWQAVWAQDPLGESRRLIPIVVELKCPRPGLLQGVVGVDLSGLDEAAAESRLLQAAKSAVVGRVKPVAKPVFPGSLA